MSVVIDQTKAVGKEIDYKQFDLYAPSYQYSRILPLSGTQSLTLTGGANQEVLMELPTKGFNLCQSVLQYKCGITGATYAWSPADTFGEVNQVELYTRSGQFLARVEDANNYMRVVRPKETPLDAFLSNDAKDGLCPSNKLANVNYLSVSTLGNFTSAKSNYTEQLYNIVSGSGTVLNNYRHFRLGYLLNTLFSVDKTLLFPEVLILRVIFNSTKAGWNSNSATDPSSTAQALSAVTISELQLLLAVEQNPIILKDLAEKIRVGFKMEIPFVYRYKNNLSGTSQNVSVRLNRGHGIRCQKIIHAVFHGTESASGTMFDHSNIGADENTALKVTEYYTMLDNNRLQQYNLNGTLNKGDDYIIHKKMLKGSVLQNQQIYSYNWFHCDSFENQPSPHDIISFPVDKDNINSGIELNIERKWDFVGVTTLAGPWNHYSFICVSKELMISPTMISCV